LTMPTAVLLRAFIRDASWVGFYRGHPDRAGGRTLAGRPTPHKSRFFISF
jgi:hypothetical protein